MDHHHRPINYFFHVSMMTMYEIRYPFFFDFITFSLRHTSRKQNKLRQRTNQVQPHTTKNNVSTLYNDKKKNRINLEITRNTNIPLNKLKYN